MSYPLGRPPKELTEDRENRIIGAIEAGNTRACAAHLAGISPSTLTDWITRGRNGDPLFSAFAVRLKEADAKAEELMVSRVRAASLETWQSAAWWLERRRHNDWGKREPEPETRATHAIDLSRLSIQDMRAYYQLRLKAATDEADIVECKRHLEALEGVQ